METSRSLTLSSCTQFDVESQTLRFPTPHDQRHVQPGSSFRPLHSRFVGRETFVNKVSSQSVSFELSSLFTISVQSLISVSSSSESTSQLKSGRAIETKQTKYPKSEKLLISSETDPFCLSLLTKPSSPTSD